MEIQTGHLLNCGGYSTLASNIGKSSIIGEESLVKGKIVVCNPVVVKNKMSHGVVIFMLWILVNVVRSTYDEYN